MTFSVVIPTKNEEEYLHKLLRSIKSQSLRPQQVIVADADSIDRTKIIAEKFGAKVVKGGLPGRGRNLGARLVRSDVIFFLDADVILKDRNFFQKALKEFEDHQLDIATADILPIEGTKYDNFSHQVYNRYVRIWGRARPHTPGFCVIVKKKLHDKIKGFDETVLFAEDQEYGFRAGKIGKFGILESVKVDVSMRRFDRDGRMSIAVKYILVELHLMFLGPVRHNAFNYTFGYEKKK